MALDDCPEEYVQAKADILTYCYENDIAFPIEEYPFEWPHLQPRSPSPDEEFVEGILASPNITLDEELKYDIDPQYIDEVHKEPTDLLFVSRVNDFRYETPLLPVKIGPDELRSYGPPNMKTLATSLCKECPKSQREMAVPADTKEVMTLALQNDARMTVVQQHANYLKDVISTYNDHQGVDFVHTKTQFRDTILSPPLIPYRPPIPPKYETLLDPKSFPDYAKFDDRGPSSSPDIWDHFSPIPEEYLEAISQHVEKNMSPARPYMINDPIKNLEFEQPLTPESIKKPKMRPEDNHFSSLKSFSGPASPQSPETDPMKTFNDFQMTLLQENLSIESSLRIRVPEIAAQSPTQNNFPRSMLGIFVANEGLCCVAIARSTIDILNEEMKWQPFAKLTRFNDSWDEEVDGEWESYVQYAGSRVDKDIVVLLRDPTAPNDEVLDKGAFQVGLNLHNVEHEDYLDVLEAVRKRKILDQHEKDGDLESTGSKRMRWTHVDRIHQFMSSKGVGSPDVPEVIPFRLLSYEIRAVEKVPQSTSVSLSETREDVVAPLLSLESLPCPKVIILSTTTLQHRYLTTFLKNTFAGTIFLERDLTRPDQLNNEGDIILSPWRCVILATMAEITQTLPSNESKLIAAVGERYRQIDVLVMTTWPVRGKDIATFVGWTTNVNSRHNNIRVVFANGKEEINRWAAWLCIPREADRIADTTDFLRHEETEEELYLRNIFNAYTSQVILGRTTVWEILKMSHDSRMRMLGDIISEEDISRLQDFAGSESEH